VVVQAALLRRRHGPSARSRTPSAASILIAQSWAVLSEGGRRARGPPWPCARPMKSWSAERDGLILLLARRFIGGSPSRGYIAAYPPGFERERRTVHPAAAWTSWRLHRSAAATKRSSCFGMINPSITPHARGRRALPRRAICRRRRRLLCAPRTSGAGVEPGTRARRVGSIVRPGEHSRPFRLRAESAWLRSLHFARLGSVRADLRLSFGAPTTSWSRTPRARCVAYRRSRLDGVEISGTEIDLSDDQRTHEGPCHDGIGPREEGKPFIPAARQFFSLDAQTQIAR